MPALDKGAITAVLGQPRVDVAVERALALGFLTSDHGQVELHPLLRQFLREKLVERTESEVHLFVARVGKRLLELERWDDALTVAEEFRLGPLLETALELSFDELLREGRVSSVERWLELADILRITSPALEIAASEVALRRGVRARAEAFALAALAQSPQGDSAARALILAGRAAYFDDRYDEANAYFRKARAEAATTRQVRESLWGLFICLNQCDSDEAALVLDEFVQRAGGDPEAELRAATARCILVDRVGNALGAKQAADRAAHLVTRSRDPMIRSSFMNARARALAQAGRYADALAIADEGREEASRYRLDFAESILDCTEGMAQLGLRRFSAARLSLARAASKAERLGDLHNQVDAAAIRCRLLVAMGRARDAIAVAEPRWERLPSPVMWSELAACRALALACLSDARTGDALAESGKHSTAWFSRLICLFADAILQLQRQSPEAEAAVDRALDSTTETGIVDPFVCAYRGFPALLERAVRRAQARETIHRILAQANDHELGRRVGLNIEARVPHAAGLSPREEQVLALVSDGLMNKQVAATLYISESTVKVHVRHILEKLGAQSRTEAVALAQTRG